MSQKPNAYEILGLSKSANESEIRVAYRKAVKKAHPDKHRNDPTATERVKILTEARDALLDPLTRARIDNPGVPIANAIPDFRVDVKVDIAQAYNGDVIQVEYFPDLLQRTAKGLEPSGKMGAESMTLTVDGNSIPGGLRYIPDAKGSKMSGLETRGNVSVLYSYNPSDVFRRVKDDLVISVSCSLTDVCNPTTFKVPLPTKSSEEPKWIYVKYDPNIDEPITSERNLRYIPSLGFKTTDGVGQLVLRFTIKWPYPLLNLSDVKREHLALDESREALSMVSESTVAIKEKQTKPQCPQM